jgi:hypothetical protein
MAISTALSKASAQPSTKQNQEFAWDAQYVIDTLPEWVYQNNKEPDSIKECKALISKAGHTLRDIDLQIQIRNAELETETRDLLNIRKFHTWRCQALKAKQSQNYILNAYNYWLALNKTEPLDVSEKLDKLIVLLAEDPDDFLLRVKALIY